MEVWAVTRFMAKKDEATATDQASRIWAWGTLAELYLIKPEGMAAFGVSDNEDAMTKAMKLVQKIAASDKAYDDAKESTARQLERYIHWWPNVYSTSFPAPLAAHAKMLRELLPSLEEFN
jgi:hypothetical protein